MAAQEELSPLTTEQLLKASAAALDSRYFPQEKLRKILLRMIRAVKPSQRRLTVEGGKKKMLPKANIEELKAYARTILSDLAPDDAGKRCQNLKQLCRSTSS